MHVPKGYSLETLPQAVQDQLLASYHLKNVKSYRSSRDHTQGFSGEAGGLFGMLNPTPASSIDAQAKLDTVFWATDNYVGRGKNPTCRIAVDDFSLIVPRVEKAKEEQKRRTKDKAEVFTPSWVCNLQNNLIDDEVLYGGAFNSAVASDKTWKPNLEPVSFTETYTWAHYVAERRLEMTAGEAPYLMSRYDTVTGDFIPVRDASGAYQRIGFLDRKLRVVAENADKDLWVTAALTALRATYGYEWQGDNLLLARLNFLNTFVDYHKDFFGYRPDDACLLEVAEIASWNLWQMDGLKMVAPETCSTSCKACTNKQRAGHDGLVSLVRFGSKLKPFEDML